MAAKQKGDYPDIYDELIRIRRLADDGLTPHVVAASPTLCRLLGNGDPFLATGELRDRLSTAAARGDRAILAFWYSLNRGKHATERITEAGNRLAVEYRRARDLSDEGALKLSQIIGSDQEWQVPFMGCGLAICGWDITVEGYVLVATGFEEYRHPHFIFDDEYVQLAYQVGEEGNWERHKYGPATFKLEKDRHRVQMRRIGSPRIRVACYVRSDNPAVSVRSALVLLDFVADFVLHRA